MEKIEHSYLERVGLAHRKKFAQFFTPKFITEFMLNWILAGSTHTHIFDPAFGLGAFYYHCPEKVHFLGQDIDPEILNYFTSNFPNADVTLFNKNYLLSFGKKYQNIICNPPYLKFQYFDDRKLIFEEIEKHYGVKLSGYTNIASAFLVKAICELATGGRLAFIMPSEFLNTGYGKTVKELLILKKHLYAIIKIECETDVFSDATTSLCILLYDSAESTKNLSFFSVNTIDKLSNILNTTPVSYIPYSQLNPDVKWDVYFNLHSTEYTYCNSRLVKLSTYGHFSRGIATGANEFFILKKSDITSLKLEERDYIPCITKSCQITTPIFDECAFKDLLNADAPVLLFNPTDPISPAAKMQIEYGEKNEFNKGFLTKNRSPWYKMEHRNQAPILLNVFSRGGYKVVRNYSSAKTLTSYHCFYPNLFGNIYIDALFLYLYSRTGHKILSSAKREYGNKLAKFEPNDLNNAMVPTESFLSSIPQYKIEELLMNLRKGIDIQPDLDEMFQPLLIAK